MVTARFQQHFQKWFINFYCILNNVRRTLTEFTFHFTYRKITGYYLQIIVKAPIDSNSVGQELQYIIKAFSCWYPSSKKHYSNNLQNVFIHAIE